MTQHVVDGTKNKDAVEGETIRLDCRFDPNLLDLSDKFIFYWHRTSNRGTDAVAFKETALDKDYNVEYSPNEGKYDLLISHAQYDRDNGKFECKIKKASTIEVGIEVKSVSYTVTILSE